MRCACIFLSHKSIFLATHSTYCYVCIYTVSRLNNVAWMLHVDVAFAIYNQLFTYFCLLCFFLLVPSWIQQLDVQWGNRLCHWQNLWITPLQVLALIKTILYFNILLLINEFWFICSWNIWIAQVLWMCIILHALVMPTELT